LQTKINDETLCLKIKNAVLADLPTDINSKNLKKPLPIEETLELLKNPNIEPALTPQQIIKVAFATQPDKVEARELVENLYQLWTLHARKQEQELLISLAFQGVTGEIIKDLFAIFYEPLAEVYKSANIGDTIGHVSNFINDLLEVIEKSDVQGDSNTTQPFIDLVQRHESEFYQFVHNVHAQDQAQLFDSLLQYADGLFNFATNGIPKEIDLYKITSDAGVSPTEYPELKKEIDELIVYHRNRKQRHLDRKRQKLMSSTDIADSQEAFDFLPGDNKEIMKVFNDMAEIEDDSEDDCEDGSSYTSESSQIVHEMTLHAPGLRIIPRIVPTFVESVKQIFISS
jgi:DNA-binding ferritin-like protein